jgi:hypothetical protein
MVTGRLFVGDNYLKRFPYRVPIDTPVPLLRGIPYHVARPCTECDYLRFRKCEPDDWAGR